MANIEEKVENLISKTIEDLGYELYDVVYEKEAQDYYLRIFIDTPNGISLNDCEKVNDAINDMLDEANYIKDQYFLEVSSPGIERVLRKEKHLQASIGKEVTCNLFRAIVIKDGKEEKSEKTTEEITQQEIKSKKKKLKSQKNISFKQIEGTLKSFDKEKIVLQVQLANQKLQAKVEIERKNIATMRLKYNWE